MLNELSIIVFSVDSYSDLWNTFFKIFDMYWENCQYDRYLVTNKKSYINKNVNCILCGENVGWIDRSIYALQKITTKYIMFFHEDYLIGDIVYDNDIKDIIKIMENEEIYFYKFKDIPKTRQTYVKYPFLGKVLHNQRYGMNLQVGIWKRETFLNMLIDLKDNGSITAWDVEKYFLKKVKSEDNEPIKGIASDHRDILKIQPGVEKGKWKRTALKYYKKRGVVINTYDRQIMTLPEDIKMRLIDWIKKHLDESNQAILKRIAKKIGINFFVE